MLKMSRLDSLTFGLLLLFVASVFTFFRTLGHMPQILRDEWVYYTQSIIYGPYEASGLGATSSFFYEFLYSSASVCGNSYYACVKGINWLLFLGLVVGIFFFLAKFAGYLGSSVISSAILLSPFSLYVSVFMPEILFAVLATLSLYFFWRVLFNSSWRVVGVTSFLLALAMNTKGHGIILLASLVLAGVIAFAILRDRTLVGRIVVLFGGAILLRFILGFVFAGPRSFDILGGYFDSDIEGSGAGRPSTSTIFETALYVFAGSYLEYLFSLLVILSLPIVAFSRANTLSKETLVGWTIIATVGLVFLATAFAFAVYVTLNGDDHSSRALARYYEWIFIPMAVYSIYEILRAKSGVSLWPPIAYLLASLGIIGLYFREGGTFNQADGLFGITAAYWNGLLIVWAVFALVVLITAALTKSRGSERRFPMIVLSSWSVIMILSGIFTNQGFADFRGERNSADAAGVFTADLLRNVPGDQIGIIANNKFDASTAAMAIQKKNLTVYESVISFPQIPSVYVEKTPWLLLIGKVSVEGDHELIITGVDYSVIRQGDRRIHYFNRVSPNSPVSDYIGEYFDYQYGVMPVANDFIVNLSSPVQSNFEIRVQVDPSLIGGELKMTLFPSGRIETLALTDSGEYSIFLDPNEDTTESIGITTLNSEGTVSGGVGLIYLSID